MDNDSKSLNFLKLLEVLHRTAIRLETEDEVTDNVFTSDMKDSFPISTRNVLVVGEHEHFCEFGGASQV
jgi:formylmethanofuran dehydrogenase subunit E-like metal-binding protein